MIKKLYWTTNDGKKINLSEYTDINHLINIRKMIVRRLNIFYEDTCESTYGVTYKQTEDKFIESIDTLNKLIKHLQEGNKHCKECGRGHPFYIMDGVICRCELGLNKQPSDIING